jgi:hypothetical protein
MVKPFDRLRAGETSETSETSETGETGIEARGRRTEDRRQNFGFRIADLRCEM